MAEPVVRLEGVFKTYPGGPHVLDGVDLTVSRGQVVSLTGASGSGKSTMISLLAGLAVPDEGRVVVDGQDVASLDDTSRARLRARRIGIVLQSGNLIPFLTASENVALVGAFADADISASTRAVRLLDELGVGQRRHHLPRRLSGGEAQRVAVAVALANDPALLLADEVTGQLDSTNADRVMQTIFDVGRRRGLTILFVTHNEALAGRATRQLVLEGGLVHER
jgi:putative ABC transport system ATP-binding protein